MYTSEHPIISVTADTLCVFLSTDSYKNYILLVKRGKDPFKDHWALPGGFINPGETARAAAFRELQEETGLEIDDEDELVFDSIADRPDRDPRGPTISLVHGYYGIVSSVKNLPVVTGGDDASEAAWFNMEELDGLDIAFDHRDIISDGD